ncbi:MAG: carbohydrate ABC transporter permease, partial [Burkholderiales bacterium]|nr:carbohydrate ABC transporter permease [Anaerolineae bacterium]
MIDKALTDVSKLSNAGYESDAAFEARLRKRITRYVWLAFALVAALTFSFPLYFMVSSSFKAENEILTTPIHWFPEDFQGINQYVRAFNQAPIGRFFFNSTLMAVLDVVFTVFFSALAGYGFAKFKFKGKQFLFMLVISTMLVPFQILLIPLYVQMQAFGWNNSYLGLIVPGLLNAFGVFMMRQFAYNIPDELLDAARIDGASEIRIFWRLVFPLLAPASASLAIIIFLFSWN